LSFSGATTYKANITYNYKVEGIDYTGDKVNFGDYSSSNSSHASAVLSRYPPGKAVKVYYSPKQPKLAVLETGSTWSTYFLFAFGTVFTIAGAAMAIAFVKYGDRLVKATE